MAVVRNPVLVGTLFSLQIVM